MSSGIVGFCKRCGYKIDIILFTRIEDSYQCPKCGSYKVKVIFRDFSDIDDYLGEEPDEVD